MLEVKDFQVPVIGRGKDLFLNTEPYEINDRMEIYKKIRGDQSNGANFLVIQTNKEKTYLVKNVCNDVSNYGNLAHAERRYLNPQDEKIVKVNGVVLIACSSNDYMYFSDQTSQFNYYKLNNNQ